MSTDTATGTGTGTDTSTGTGTDRDRDRGTGASVSTSPPGTGQQPAASAAPAANADPVVSAAPADLSEFISRLSPDQLAKVRALAASRGISTGPRRGPGGGLLIEIEIPPEACEPMQTWAESAGEPFEVFVRKIAADAITNYCFGDWSAVRPAEQTAPAVSTTGAAGQ
jgi:hypothetical protein